MIIMLFNTYFANYTNHPMNVSETSDGWEIWLRAVGLKKEDLDIKLDDDVLWIKSKDKKEDEKNWTRHEFRGDWFDSKIQMPTGYDETKIEAKTEDGILKITIGKSNTSQSKQIEVK